jgi:hypothetical protein
MLITYPPDISQNPLFQNKKNFYATLYFDQHEYDVLTERILIPAFLLNTNNEVQNSAVIILTNDFAEGFQKLIGINEELPAPNLFSLTGEFYFNQSNSSGYKYISLLKIDSLEIGSLSISYKDWQDDALVEHLSNIFY